MESLKDFPYEPSMVPLFLFDRRDAFSLFRERYGFPMTAIRIRRSLLSGLSELK
jgi:hypothetical protein